MSMDLKEMYKAAKRMPNIGIEGYEVEAKYVDPLKQVAERELLKQVKGQKNRRYVTERGNFLLDEIKMHKNSPDPCKYTMKDEWPQKEKRHIKPSNKLTYLDEIVRREKKEKKPAPGTYDVVKTLKQQLAETKKMAQRKINRQDRDTYLDGIMHGSSVLPGVGSYNPRQRAKTETNNRTTPEDWRKKHQAVKKKKPLKEPNMGTYNPLPSNYDLFSKLNKVKENKNLLGKVQRFKTESSGSGLAPHKYNVIQQWAAKKSVKHGLEVLSKGTAKSVYYH